VLVGRQIRGWDQIQEAAREIHAMGVANVVIKGGHIEDDKMATDILFDGRGFRDYTAPRVATMSTHGTGCTFASAVAAMLAKGETVPLSVAGAKAYVTKALQSAYKLGHGHGPVHHFYRFWRPIED
jgi:hydroxymethylpyrimidine kinase/phosphomethylpyrimidine kinase